MSEATARLLQVIGIAALLIAAAFWWSQSW